MINMKKSAAVTVVAVLMVTTTLLTAGCLDSDDDEWDGTIRVAYLQGDIHQVAYFVAKSAAAGGGESFFEQYNVKVENAKGAPYPSGKGVMDAFQAGDVDIGYLGSPPAITGHVNAEIPTKVIAQVNSLGSAIVVKEGINNASDLKGKTIATPGQSTIQHFMLLIYLENNGLVIGDGTEEVQVTSLVGPTLMKATMEAGDIDGFIAWQPFPADAVDSGVGHVLADSTEIWPGHICCVVGTMEKFVKDHPAEVTNYLRAHVAATKWMQLAMADKESDEYALLVQISVDFTGRNELVVKESLDGMEYGYALDGTFKPRFTDYTEKLIDQGTLTQEALDNMGYASAQDLTDNYVDDKYIKDAETSL
jgi:NitT/TauT family transport system substrate-binding protein